MVSSTPWSPSPVLLNIGGKKYATTVDTLTQREPNSMLAAMFSGRHNVCRDSETGMVFVDRDGKQFRHILNWLRDGIIPTLTDMEYQELLREAEYYQLQGLMEYIKANSCRKKDEDISEAEFTRKEIIKIIQSDKVRFRGVNLSGLDLSKLDSVAPQLQLSVYCLYHLLNFVDQRHQLTSPHKDLSFVDLSNACIRQTNFSCANLFKAKLGDVEAEGSIFQNAILRECEFHGANLTKAVLDRSNLQSANLQDACLVGCSFFESDLRSAHLQNANLKDANLKEANLEGANLKGAKLNGANLQSANLQRAYLRDVDLRDTHMDGATRLGGANLLGAIR